MKKSLLEHAKSSPPHPIHRKVDPELKDLALAWAFDEVTFSQVQRALGKTRKSTNGCYTRLARALREILQDFTRETN